MFKKLLAVAVLALSVNYAYADNPVIKCDPNATGSVQYPNANCDSSGHLQVNVVNSPTNFTVPSAVALTDGSGTITTGNTSQQIFAANASRRYLFIQNTSSGNLWINFGASATEGAGAGSIIIFPNASFVMESGTITNQTVNINGGSAGQSFVAKQY